MHVSVRFIAGSDSLIASERTGSICIVARVAPSERTGFKKRQEPASAVVTTGAQRGAQFDHSLKDGPLFQLVSN